ncbi:MAG: hypothetical protein RMK57_13220 [Bryobacterales bacterium]|nr:hypothetical protein [Bryobacteraceae bacterium]MDW8355478.1 hypothetical protein [Bryobacterales bacterium]
MPRVANTLQDRSFLAAALEGLELQRSRIEEQIRQIRALLGARRGRVAAPFVAAVGKPVKRRQLSAAARRRIALAQKRRWAEYRKQRAAMAKAKEA